MSTTDSCPRTTVGRYLIQRLQDLGIQHVFGIPGDYVLDFMDRVVDSPLHLVGNCNELNAGYAADGYARMHGVGAVIVTYNVGGLSLVNAVAGAFAERVPMVVISGAPKTQHQKQQRLVHHLVSDYDLQLDVYRRLTAAAVRLDRADDAPRSIDQALVACMTRRLPVYLELPMDMVDQPCEAPRRLVFDQPPTSDADALAECVQDIARRLQAAERPALLLGFELHRLQLVEAVRHLVDASGLSFATTMGGKGLLAESHPTFLGVYQGAVTRPETRERIETADCLLTLGAWMTDVTTGGFTARFITDRTMQATASRVRIQNHLFENVYLHDFIPALAAALSSRGDDREPLQAAPQQSSPALPSRGGDRDPLQARPAEPLTVARLFEHLEHFIGEDTLVVADIGDSLFGASELHLPAGGQFVAQGYYGSIGYAIPATLGVCLARPHQRPLVIEGDGSFQVSGNELSTLLRCGCRPVIVLLNNNGYVIERCIQDGPYNDLQPWRYHTLVQSYGGSERARALDAATVEELEAALAWAREHPEHLVFIEAHLPEGDHTTAMGRLTAEVRRMQAST